MATPCVYVQHPRSGRPAYLHRCDSVHAAVSLAFAVRQIFGRAAWVADWASVAHQPSAIERELEAIERGDYAEADRIRAARDREFAELMDRR